MRVLSVDPGVTSGICYASIRDGRLRYFPFQAVDDVDEFWNRIAEFKPKHIVMESFEFRNTPHRRTGTNLFPVQLIGIARLYTFRSECMIHLQSPGQGKGYYTDNMLKQLGLYKRGIPHGTDAARHLLHWATFGFGHQFVDPLNREFATRLESWIVDSLIK